MSRSRLYVENYAPSVDDFVVSEETGLWLLPPEIAERDRDAGIERLEADGLDKKVHTKHTREQAHRLLGRTSITDMGCFEDGLRGKQEPSDWAYTLAELEMGTFTLDDPADKDYLCVCGNVQCYNPRHHDLAFGRTNLRERTLELNPNWYSTMPDGRIQTIWGEVLPSVAASSEALQEFKQQYYPYVPYDESRLTAAPVSQIRLHPVSGCWEAYRYEVNTTGLANAKTGYGIVYDRHFSEVKRGDDTEIVKRRGDRLAHIVTWREVYGSRRAGAELNHLCFYTRCCNPLHIEEVSPEENRDHGNLVRSQIRLLETEHPETVGAFASARELYEATKSLSS